MREYVLYEVTNIKLVREGGNRWRFSSKEVLDLYEKKRPIIDSFKHECECLVGPMLGRDIEVEASYIVDGDDSIIGGRVIIQVDDTAINFSDYDAETIKFALNEGIEEASRSLKKLSGHSRPESTRFVRDNLELADDCIGFKSVSAYRIASEIRSSGILSDGIILHGSENEVIEIDPIVDKPVVTIQDDETIIYAVFHQITGSYITKVNIVSSSQGGKKIGRTTDLKIQNEHKKLLCYAMGDDAVVKLLVKTEKKMSAGYETVASYELIRIIEIIDQKDSLNDLKLANHLPGMQYALK